MTWIVANKLYEPQAYVIETNHLLHTLNMVGSKATYDALPADIQQLVSECAAEAHQYARQMADERIEGQKSTIQDAGLEIITLEPAMIQEMADVSANVYDLVREQIGTDLVGQPAGTGGNCFPLRNKQYREGRGCEKPPCLFQNHFGPECLATVPPDR